MSLLNSDDSYSLWVIWSMRFTSDNLTIQIHFCWWDNWDFLRLSGSSRFRSLMSLIHLVYSTLEVLFRWYDDSDSIRLIRRLRFTSDFRLSKLQKSQFSNLGELSLLFVQRTKARSPWYDQTVVDPLHRYPTATVVPPHELLISSNLEDFSIFKGFNLCSSYDSDSWISSTLMKSVIPSEIYP